MAQLANSKCKGDWSLNGDWVARHEKQFAELQAESRKVDPTGSLVGAIVSFPWADGAAYYRVSSDKPLKLQPIPCLDAWEVPYSQIRGLRRIDVIREIESDRRIAEAMDAARQENNYGRRVCKVRQ